MKRLSSYILKGEVIMVKETQMILHEEIRDEFNELGKLPIGTEEYRIAVDSITKLMDREIEMKRVDMEYNDKIEARETEYQFKREQMQHDSKRDLIKNTIDICGIVLPVGVTIWGTLKSFEFEKEGTITTMLGRGFINKLLPRK